MSRTVGKPMYVLKDIWYAYAARVLKENPEWWSKYAKTTSHYYIYRKTENNKVEEVMNYARFRQITEMFLDRARSAIIDGKAIHFSSGMGKIAARRVERDFRNERQKQVDWKSTRKHNKMIFYTSDDWIRIAWYKTNFIEGSFVYEFRPSGESSARRGTGFRTEFSKANEKDPLLKYQYHFVPLTH